MSKVVLITGASSGIGQKTAIELKTKGFIVYGAARRLEKMSDLKNIGINIISLDITDETSIKNCVDFILKKEGKIDILINNAGYGSFGAIEDVPIEEAKKQFEVNIFGLARITQLVLPSMRSNNYGKIVNIASMGGRIWTGFGGWYHATKFALEGLSASMRLEVKPFNIDVIIIEPGAIKTNWGNIASESLLKVSGEGPYKNQVQTKSKNFIKQYSSNLASEPKLIAKCIGKAVTKRHPKTRYLIGYGAKPLVYFQKIFGDRLFDKLISKIF